MLVDEFMPTYDIADAAATVVQADTQSTWDALMDVDVIEVGRSKPLVGFDAIGRVERLLVKALKAPEGDFRDWEAIRDWARSVAADLGDAG